MVLRPPTLVSQKRPHQTLVQSNVLSIRKDDAADSYHVHVADGFPDDGERVMPDFLAGISVHLGVNLETIVFLRGL